LFIYASAPIQYDTREFILHLFSRVCEKVIRPADEVKAEPGPEFRLSDFESGVRTAGAQRIVLPLTSLLKPLRWVVLALGTFLVGAALLIAATTRYLQALSLDAGSLFVWGLTLAGLGSALILHSFMAGRHATKPHDEKSHPGNELSVAAQEWLRVIRFQQTYTSGWAGSLKFPIGLEGGVSGAVSLAERQMSLPQIVDSYTTLINHVTDEYQVIIGIDELDKMESDDKAQEFLNQIKALFGIDRCFYIVSVSESAMSRFERRGLPFRDVFDSSFDEIVYVGYLNFEKARELLDTRVIGIPVAFVALAYCASGGLPRDLIRACRDLFERLRANPAENGLLALSTAVIKADLDAKVHSIIVEVRKLEKESESAKADLLTTLRQLEGLKTAEVTADRLLDACNGLFDSKKNEGEEQGREQTRSLCRQLAGYLYYCATLLEVFGRRADPESWQLEDSSQTLSEWLDRLAGVRQDLALSADIATTTLTRFREGSEMRIPPALAN
jgi:hypothetical protein